MYRVRSLSVGNENRWIRGSETMAVIEAADLVPQHNNHHNAEILTPDHQNMALVAVAGGNGGGGNGGKSDEECWHSSLRRRELIEIVRESMERNRLCFQANNR